ncbi:MAG TPA: recombinase family protein [Candidatus Angelobacter sp.]|nr:recombinase family protein [Candidatus Angelobacter sp.]
MNTFFGYIRVSTVRQGERGVSLPEQKEAIERHAARNGLTITQWFEEQQTAAKKGRPIWTKMLRLLRQGKATGVIIHKIDRSARNLKDWADLGELIDSGLEVHFANESLDLASRGGRLSADIQAVVASDYIRNLREEAKKGIYGRLKQGFYPMRAPIGYLNNGQGKAKTVDPTKGSLIRQAFERYRTTKFSIPALCDEMFRRGLRNHANGRVSQNGMATILRNPFYMGLIRIKKTNQTFQGNHEPLIPTHLFEDVQDILEGRFTARPKRHEFLFRRIVKCNICNYSLIGELQKGHVYYRCHTRDCPTTGIREEEITAIVKENLRKLAFTEPERQYLNDAIIGLKKNWIKDRQEHITQATIKLQQVAHRITRLTDAYLDQTIDKDIFEERKVSLLFERQANQEIVQKLKDGTVSVPDALHKFLELAGAAYSLYENALLTKRRALVKMTTSNLSLNQKTIDFAFAKPFKDVADREKDADGGPSKGLARTLDALLISLQRGLSTDENYLPE